MQWFKEGISFLWLQFCFSMFYYIERADQHPFYVSQASRIRSMHFKPNFVFSDEVPNPLQYFLSNFYVIITDFQ